MSRKNKEEEREYQRQWYLKNKERKNEHSRLYAQRNKEKIGQYQHNRYMEQKKKVLSYYCNKKEEPECLWCGERRLPCLSIDHLDGGGYKHRKSVRAQNFYSWLIKQGYPEGYQTLCMNCQFIKRASNRECGGLRS